MATARSVLISGAGIAGPTLAFWLARRGFRPTVIERGEAIRSSGSPVDVQGAAVDVVDKMGILPQLREARTKVTDLVFVDEHGRRAGRIAMRAFQQSSGDRELEIPRSDLGKILYEASRDDAEFVFHDAITSLDQDGEGVEVSFEHAPPRRFDLVVGADGLHSAVRRIAFGPESEFVAHCGLFVATLPIAGAAANRHEVTMFNAPGRSLTLHPSREQALAAFIFRAPELPEHEKRDTERHRRLIVETYAADGWRVPEVLRDLETAADFYFDSVSRVTIASWSRGRVALLGDAASCVSLLGGGSSNAIAGAYTLAQGLAESPDDHAAAFARYEGTHRRLVEPRQRGVERAASLLVPETRGGIRLRNAASRLWPIAAGAGWLARHLRPSAVTSAS